MTRPPVYVTLDRRVFGSKDCHFPLTPERPTALIPGKTGSEGERRGAANFACRTDPVWDACF